MTENCDICGRGMAEKQLKPAWYLHGPVCRRRGCKEAVRDALHAIVEARERYDPLVGEIATRHRAQHAPIGYRGDAMAGMDMDGEVWWATEVVKRV